MGNYFVAAVSSAMLLEGLKNMVVGLGVVFGVLILLCVIIWAFKFLDAIGANDAKTEAKPAPSFAPFPKKGNGNGQMEEDSVQFEDVDEITAAVILGAVAEESGGNFKVTSIKRSN